MSPSIEEDVGARNAGYDYTIPGHVFIIKNDNPYSNQQEEAYTEV